MVKVICRKSAHAAFFEGHIHAGIVSNQQADQGCEMRLVPDYCDTMCAVFFVHFCDQQIRVAHRDQVVAQGDICLGFENICKDISGLFCADVWTGQDQVEFDPERAQSLCDLTHFLFAFISQRALAVIFVFGHSFIYCNGMTDQKQVHFLFSSGIGWSGAERQKVITSPLSSM